MIDKPDDKDLILALTENNKIEIIDSNSFEIIRSIPLDFAFTEFNIVRNSNSIFLTKKTKIENSQNFSYISRIVNIPELGECFNCFFCNPSRR